MRSVIRILCGPTAPWDGWFEVSGGFEEVLLEVVFEATLADVAFEGTLGAGVLLGGALGAGVFDGALGAGVLVEGAGVLLLDMMLGDELSENENELSSLSAEKKSAGGRDVQGQE